MTRVKGATHAIKRRRKILSRTKGYRFGRSTKEREAKVAMIKAGVSAYTHRKNRKGDFRRLWQIKINAAARRHGLSYSALMGILKRHNIGLDRKVLAGLAERKPDTFERIVTQVKK
jgi:large subunit ribosomal protein L20